MKISVEATAVVTNEVSEKLARLRYVKREASRRCRARQKAIVNGELLTPELMVRSLQPTAMRMENFKMQVENTTVRLNRNGGEKVAVVISENGKTVRKSYKDMPTAVKVFNGLVGTLWA
jgi:hypothetical protein